MAKRQLKPWHTQVTTGLAVLTLLVVLAFFAQSFQSFFLTERDPVLVAVERIKQRPASDGPPSEGPARPER